jgi:hypothetical protein
VLRIILKLQIVVECLDFNFNIRTDKRDNSRMTVS